MPNNSIEDFLAVNDACNKGAKWLRTQPDMATAWDHCPNPGWMLWALHKIGVVPADKTMCLLACRFVRETPLFKIQDNIQVFDGRKVWDLPTDERSRNAVVISERFANGEATTEELAAAWDAAWAAWDATRAAWAATRAAWAAARVAWAAARVAAWASMAAAWADVWADAGADARAVRAEQTRIIREMIPNPWIITSLGDGTGHCIQPPVLA